MYFSNNAWLIQNRILRLFKADCKLIGTLSWTLTTGPPLQVSRSAYSDGKQSLTRVRTENEYTLPTVGIDQSRVRLTWLWNLIGLSDRHSFTFNWTGPSALERLSESQFSKLNDILNTWQAWHEWLINYDSQIILMSWNKTNPKELISSRGIFWKL